MQQSVSEAQRKMGGVATATQHTRWQVPREDRCGAMAEEQPQRCNYQQRKETAPRSVQTKSSVFQLDPLWLVDKQVSCLEIHGRRIMPSDMYALFNLFAFASKNFFPPL